MHLFDKGTIQDEFGKMTLNPSSLLTRSKFFLENLTAVYNLKEKFVKATPCIHEVY